MRQSKSIVTIGLLLFAAGLKAQCMFDPAPPCQAFWRAEVVFTGVVTRTAYSETYLAGEGENRWNRFSNAMAALPVKKLHVQDKGCVLLDFITEADGGISGRVFDDAGQPMPTMRLDLARADQDPNDSNPQTFWAYADEKGNYEFHRIPPGRYVLGIRLNAIRDFDFAYKRTYYPSVANAGDARVFTLKAGQKISGVDFSMPRPLGLRTVSGTVVWPDGRPVRNAGISVMISDYAYGMGHGITSSDDEGRFSVQLYAGLSYWINATVSMPGAKQMHAEPVDLPSEGDVKELKLVVESSMGSCERCRFRYGPKKKGFYF